MELLGFIVVGIIAVLVEWVTQESTSSTTRWGIRTVGLVICGAGYFVLKGMGFMEPYTGSLLPFFLAYGLGLVGGYVLSYFSPLR